MNLSEYIPGLRSRDREATIAFYSKVGPRVLKDAKSRGIPAADADDILQATLCKILEEIDDGLSDLTLSYVRGKARYLQLGRWRRIAKEPEQGLVADPIAPQKHDEKMGDEIRQQIREAIQQLPPIHQQILGFFLKDPDTNNTQIARELGVTEGTIRHHKSNAFDQLREGLAALFD